MLKPTYPYRKVSKEFKDLGLKPNLYSITPMLNPRRKDTFESPEIRSPTFDAKAQIFEIWIPMLKPGVWRIQIRSPTFDAKAQIFEIRIPMLKLGVRKIQMVTKYFVWGSSWAIQRPLFGA